MVASQNTAVHDSRLDDARAMELMLRVEQRSRS